MPSEKRALKRFQIFPAGPSLVQVNHNLHVYDWHDCPILRHVHLSPDSHGLVRTNCKVDPDNGPPFIGCFCPGLVLPFKDSGVIGDILDLWTFLKR